jgi:hypothetical protein
MARRHSQARGQIATPKAASTRSISTNVGASDPK